MNILNNLWLAISTPNEILINICVSFLIVFIEAPLSFALIDGLFKLSCTKVQKYIYIFSIAIVAILTTFLIPWPYNIVFNYATAFIILYFVMKIGFIKASIATLFPSIVLNVVVSLTANPYLDLLHITYEQNTTIFIYRIPFVLFTYLIVLAFVLVLKYRKITLNILEDFDKKTKSIIMINFLFGLFKYIFTRYFKCKIYRYITN